MGGFFGVASKEECISDYEAQPLIIRSHHGTYSLTTVGKIKSTI